MNDIQGKMILIVDDDPENIQVLGEVLKKNNFKTVAALSGPQALNFVQKKLPDAILLDVMMPNMDGFEVCRQLKADPETRDIPVLFITALTEISDKLRAFTTGGADYITKPFVEKEVLARIGVHLENRNLIHGMLDANQKLQDLNQLKNKFLGIAAHDLRNPLSSLIGFSDMLLCGDFGDLPEEQAKIVKVMNSASLQMLNLVNDLLDVSVIERGKLTLLMENTSIKQLMEERIQLGQITADKKGIKMSSTLATVPTLYIDISRMAQVADNLISNAVKFSPLGSEIKISLFQEKDRILFSIQDQGSGLSTDDQQRIFGEFQKLSSKPTAGEKSTGLGMAITKKIVDAHNGHIDVDSKLGEGTTFTVSIPLSYSPEASNEMT